MHPRSPILALLALAGTCLLACAGDGGDVGDAGLVPPTTVEAGTPTTTTAFQLRSDLRAGWLGAQQWTHLYVVAAVEGDPEAPQAKARLLASEVAIATDAAAFVGAARSASLEALLRARAAAITAFVVAEQGGESSQIATARSAWDENSADVASFFAGFGPVAVPSSLAVGLRAEESATQNAIAARVSGDAKAEVSAVVEARTQALAIGDAIASVLVTRDPAAFAPSALSSADQTLRLELRPLLTESTFWFRVFVIEQMRQEPMQAFLDRTIAANSEVADAFSASYGAAVRGQIQLGLHDKLADAYAYVLATESGDADAMNATRKIFFTDATRFAHDLAATNASWPFADVQSVLQVDVDRTLGEIDARQARQWDADAADFDMLIENSGALANLFADGLAAAGPAAAAPAAGLAAAGLATGPTDPR